MTRVSDHFIKPLYHSEFVHAALNAVLWYFVSCSSFTGHRGASGTGEPPQSAQDKARMDKEYLSLMAELGEAPISSSGGGHSGSQGGGGPRSSGPSSNQPPPVRTH